MTAGEFLQQLEKELQGLHAEERENALAYYREYFEEADSVDGSDAVERLGSPQSVAARIISEVGENHAEPMVYPTPAKQQNDPPKSSGSNRVGMVILWILLILIAFPFLITLLSIWLGVIITLLALLAAFVAVAIVAPFLGIFGMLQGMMGYGLQNIGGGLLCLGLAMLLWKPFLWIIINSFKLIGRLITAGFRKCFGKEKNA